jgi:hypothetical protein
MKGLIKGLIPVEGNSFGREWAARKKIGGLGFR